MFESVAVPSDVVPSRNVAVPVAVVPAGGWIVAVKTTDWPKADGFKFEAVVVVVVA